ncbi:hypothetical protein [Pseudovibrio sp. Tun.PSC04-5.I4]|nr:hypothetical protein [Pseudovibrio sp. Tun.PSC04-5.I4]
MRGLDELHLEYSFAGSGMVIVEGRGLSYRSVRSEILDEKDGY